MCSNYHRKDEIRNKGEPMGPAQIQFFIKVFLNHFKKEVQEDHDKEWRADQRRIQIALLFTTCILCGDKFKKEFIYKCLFSESGHPFCSKCMINYITTKVEDDLILSIRWPQIFGEDACTSRKCRISDDDVFALLRIQSIDNGDKILDMYTAHIKK